MISIKNLTYGYYKNNKKYLLYNNFSADFNIGLTALTGASGSGKSTLISLIMGLAKPFEGEIIFDKTIKQVDFGYISQESELIPQLTAFENVYWKALLCFNENLAEKKSYYILEKFGIKDFKNKTDNLSGGEKQRVALARALVNDPFIIIGDEITAHLDKESTLVIINLLQELAINKIIIIASHDSEVIKSCKNIIKI